MGQKQKTKRSLKEQFYLNILSWYENKGIKASDEATIIGKYHKCFIVDKKYQKICERVMKHYEKIQKENSSISADRIKFLTAFTAFTLYAFLNSSNIKEVLADTDINSMLKEIQIEATNEEEISEIDRIYIEDAKRAEKKRILKEQFEELQKRIEEEKKIAEEQERIRIEEEQQRIAIYDSFLEEYSGYSHLDAEKVKEIAKKTTNNYEDFTSILPNKDFDLTNPEAACMLFVCYLNCDELTVSLNEFGISKAELLTTTEIETTPHDSIKELYLSNGEKYSNFYGKICDFFNIKNKSLALAVSIEEIGWNGSYSSNNRNNVRGMKYRSGEWQEFATLEWGIIGSCRNYLELYNDYTMDSILEMSCYHISGSKDLPRIEDTDDEKKIKEKEELIAEIMRWKENVSSFYYEISKNYDFYFTVEEENDYTLTRTRNE